MGWTLQDTMSLNPKQVVEIQKALYELLNRENGVQNDEKIKKAQEQEIAKKIQSLRAKGVTSIPPEKFFGLLAR